MTIDIEIISVIVGALLGGAASAIGFYFKNKREEREKINEALFQLLETWSLISLVKVISSEKCYTKLINRIQETFPHESISEKDRSVIKTGMVQSLPILTGMTAGIDGQYLSKYQSSVNDLAKIHPLLAFDLNRNNILIRLLGAIDKLAADNHPETNNDLNVSNLKNFMLDEAITSLESDLLKISSVSGRANKRKTRTRIINNQNKLNKIPDDIFDDYINAVIAPAIQAHYDALGITNPNTPNKSRESTS